MVPRGVLLATLSCLVSKVSIKVGGEEGIEGTTSGLRDVWEATSFQLERLQCDPACVEQEARDTQKTTACTVTAAVCTHPFRRPVQFVCPELNS